MALPEVTPDVDSQLADVRTQLALLRQGAGQGSEAKSIAAKMDFAQKRLDNIRQSAYSKAARLRAEHDSALSQCEYDIDSCQRKIKSLQASVANEANTTDRARTQLAALQDDAQQIRNRWAENGSQKFTLSEDDAICPHCGQQLPQDRLAEHVAQMRQRFADRKAEVFKQLTEEATRIKADMASAQHIIEVAAANTQTATQQLSDTETLLSTLQQRLAGQQAKTTPTPEQLLSEDENFAAIKDELETLRAKLENVDTGTDNDGEIKKLKDTEAGLIAAQQRNQLHQSITARISQLRDRQADLNKQLSQVERRQQAARLMQQASDNIIENAVNQLFRYVRFRLFRTQVNGARIPWCEATVDGVPFTDLNTASRINAGIDIITTLSNHYDFYAPVIIDNAEAVNQILPNDNQNILFYVTEEKQLNVS